MQGASLNLWYEALGTPLGVVVQTNDPERFRQRMYALRKEANDKMLDDLSLVVSPSNPGSHVWIVKRKQSSEA